MKASQQIKQTTRVSSWVVTLVLCVLVVSLVCTVWAYLSCPSTTRAIPLPKQVLTHVKERTSRTPSRTVHTVSNHAPNSVSYHANHQLPIEDIAHIYLAEYVLTVMGIDTRVAVDADLLRRVPPSARGPLPAGTYTIGQLIRLTIMDHNRQAAGVLVHVTGRALGVGNSDNERATNVIQNLNHRIRQLGATHTKLHDADGGSGSVSTAFDMAVLQQKMSQNSLIARLLHGQADTVSLSY